jgi:hypothetical protein
MRIEIVPTIGTRVGGFPWDRLPPAQPAEDCPSLLHIQSRQRRFDPLQGL